MTRRERLERKLEKRQQWAESRSADADRRFNAAHSIVSQIPLGQPILVGHHSEKRHRRDLDRVDANMRAGCESADMAKHHAQKAAGLADQLESSIFSDDPDAIEQLEARIAELEAERGRIKAYNASCRKKSPDESLLDDAQRRDLDVTRRVCPYQLGPNGAFPAYKLSYVGANIRRLKDRIEDIKRRQNRAQAAEDNGGVLVAVSGDRCSVTFAEKPSRDVLNALKDAGFRWGGGSWSGYRNKLPDCVPTLD